MQKRATDGRLMVRPRYTADRDVEMSLMRCKAVGGVGGKHPVQESSQERSAQCDLPVICKGMHSLESRALSL